MRWACGGGREAIAAASAAKGKLGRGECDGGRERGIVGGRFAARSRERTPDEQNGRRIHARCGVELREGGKPFALGGRRGARNDYGGNVRGQAGGEKLVAEAREIVARHVNNQRGILTGERAP